MLTDRLKQLASLKAKSARLEAQVSAEQQKELAALPAKFGFVGPEDFIAAFRAATGKRGRPSSTQDRPKLSGSGRRRRAKITDETRTQVKKLVDALVLRGDRVDVVLNGTPVIVNAQLPGIPTRGPIGLQHHGTFKDGKYDGASALVQFRNISIKELGR